MLCSTKPKHICYLTQFARFYSSKWKEEKHKLKTRRVTEVEGIDSSRTSQNSIHSSDDKVSCSITWRIPKQLKGKVSISPKNEETSTIPEWGRPATRKWDLTEAKENINSQYSEGSETGASNKLNGDKFNPSSVILVQLDQPQKGKENSKDDAAARRKRGWPASYLDGFP